MSFPHRKLLLTLIITFDTDSDLNQQIINTLKEKRKNDGDKTLTINISSKKQFLNTLSETVKKYSSTYDMLFLLSGYGHNDDLGKYVQIGEENIFDYEIGRSLYTNMHDLCTSLCLLDIWSTPSILDFPWRSTDGYVFNSSIEKCCSIYKPYSYCINNCSTSRTIFYQFLRYMKKCSKINMKDFYLFLKRYKKDKDDPIISRT